MKINIDAHKEVLEEGDAFLCRGASGPLIRFIGYEPKSQGYLILNSKFTVIERYDNLKEVRNAYASSIIRVIKNNNIQVSEVKNNE